MQCCICLREQSVDPVELPCCNNSFCEVCLNEWKLVKNVCPLCCMGLGGEQINNLCQSPQQFDNGFIILENEVKDVVSRIKHSESRVLKRSKESKNLKSMFSASHIIFLEDQLQLIKHYQSLMVESLNANDRVQCVQYLQLSAETLLSVESSLDSGCIKCCEIEYDSMDDSEDDYQDSEQEYERFEPSVLKKQVSRQRRVNRMVQQKWKTPKGN